MGNNEIHAHRAVLASISPYLFELFSSDQEQKRNENVITYKMNGGFEKGAFELLVDYAYTAQLEIPSTQVGSRIIASLALIFSICFIAR